MERNFIINLLRRRLLLHIAFWLVFAVFFSLGYIGKNFFSSYVLANFFGVLLLYFAFVYSTLYVVYDSLALRKHFIVALVSFAVLLIAATTMNAELYNRTNEAGRIISFQNFVPFYLFLAAFTLSLKIARSTYLSLADEIQQKEMLLQQKDLFLRSQIHPHFLFNTLNNFYGLAIQKADELPQLMIRLSNLLRHLIDNSELPLCSLKAELESIKDYCELEKIRYSDNLIFHFEFPENIPDNLMITPSLLIVFFENAFKHSNNLSSSQIEIYGFIRIEQNWLTFFLENSYPEKSILEKTTEGSGLKNINGRLSLMNKNDYEYRTSMENGRYSVSLKLKLSEQ